VETPIGTERLLKRAQGPPRSGVDGRQADAVGYHIEDQVDGRPPGAGYRLLEPPVPGPVGVVGEEEHVPDAARPEGEDASVATPLGPAVPAAEEHIGNIPIAGQVHGLAWRRLGPPGAAEMPAGGDDLPVGSGAHASSSVPRPASRRLTSLWRTRGKWLPGRCLRPAKYPRKAKEFVPSCRTSRPGDNDWQPWKKPSG